MTCKKNNKKPPKHSTLINIFPHTKKVHIWSDSMKSHIFLYLHKKKTSTQMFEHGYTVIMYMYHNSVSSFNCHTYAYLQLRNKCSPKLRIIINDVKCCYNNMILIYISKNVRDKNKHSCNWNV